MAKEAQRTYRIVGPEGELGEGSGATQIEALLNLYGLARKDPAFARRVSAVRRMSGGKALIFIGKGPFPANVGEVRFERVA